MAADITSALGVGPGDLVAIVGGGGKTSLLFALAQTYPGAVVMTTTTRLARSEAEMAPATLTLPDLARDPAKLAQLLSRHRYCLVVGGIEGEKALGVDAALPGTWLAWPEVDIVLVEADGARGRPIKAPAAHEPVIPRDSTLVVIVTGLDALEGPIAAVAHRPERVRAVTGLGLADTLTPEVLATLLAHDEGGLKGVPSGARVAVVLNKADSPERKALASRTKAALATYPTIERVVVTSLRP